MKHFFGLIIAAFILGACGFSPIYGAKSDQDSVRAYTRNIAIDIIPDREGQYLRNRLIDRLHDLGESGSPTHTLTLTPIREQRTNLDITRNADATRAQLLLRTNMTLTERATGAVILKRSLSTTTSFNILSSQFTTRVTENDARKNALDDLARQAEQAIILARPRK